MLTKIAAGAVLALAMGAQAQAADVAAKPFPELTLECAMPNSNTVKTEVYLWSKLSWMGRNITGGVSEWEPVLDLDLLRTSLNPHYKDHRHDVPSHLHLKYLPSLSNGWMDGKIDGVYVLIEQVNTDHPILEVLGPGNDVVFSDNCRKRRLGGL
jgi:hypothetical protein